MLHYNTFTHKHSHVYVGYDSSLDIDDVRVTHTVVLKLLEDLENRGHHKYMENLYSSPALFQDLSCLGFGAYGTILTNQRGIPEKMKAKLQKERWWITSSWL